MAKRGMEEMYPLVCPFCDELAYAKPMARRMFIPHKIYTLRQCTMGHEFYSVEEVPENQAELVDEIREVKKEAREWKSYVNGERRAERAGRGYTIPEELFKKKEED